MGVNLPFRLISAFHYITPNAFFKSLLSKSKINAGTQQKAPHNVKRRFDPALPVALTDKKDLSLSVEWWTLRDSNP